MQSDQNTVRMNEIVPLNRSLSSGSNAHTTYKMPYYDFGSTTENPFNTTKNLTYMNNTSEEVPGYWMESKEVYRQKIAITGSLSILAILSNLLCLLAIRNIPGTWTHSNFILLNLITSNMLASLCHLLTTTHELILIENQDLWNDWNIKIMADVSLYSYNMFYSASALSLLGLAINRYVAICKPYLHASLFTKARIKWFLLATWLLALFLALFLFLQWHIPVPYTIHLNMLIIWPCFFGLIFIIIIILYIHVYFEAKKVLFGRCENVHNIVNNHKAFVTTLLLTCTLVISSVPYWIAVILLVHHDNYTFRTAWNYFMTNLPIVNFMLDPIIYSARTKDIQQGYYRLAVMLCKTRDWPSQSNGVITTQTSIASVHRQSSVIYTQQNTEITVTFEHKTRALVNDI
ncbi:unnamed protein product [Owenia fusiformis]|uniref:Uncharacterized protein n=1 Tax=Owenia fusiformis TaxID=6347 RepID=A0A8J1TBH9_OWEFU|nr:unnamed protein product [Owenia fusiformis]